MNASIKSIARPVFSTLLRLMQIVPIMQVGYFCRHIYMTVIRTVTVASMRHQKSKTSGGLATDMTSQSEERALIGAHWSYSQQHALKNALVTK